MSKFIEVDDVLSAVVRGDLKLPQEEYRYEQGSTSSTDMSETQWHRNELHIVIRVPCRCRYCLGEHAEENHK